MNKFERHKGIIEFKIGEDVFKMQPTVKDFITVQKVWGGKDEDSDVSEKEVETIIDCLTGTILRVEDVNEETVKSFVQANFFSCLNGFMKMFEKDKDMKSFINKKRELIEQKKSEKD